jgi:uncharacterized low-complexity protein
MAQNELLKKTPLALAIGAAFTVSLTASAATYAAENPFGYSDLSSGYHIVNKDEEGKCGEGKCGEGKCGEGKCGEGMEMEEEGSDEGMSEESEEESEEGSEEGSEEESEEM